MRCVSGVQRESNKCWLVKAEAKVLLYSIFLFIFLSLSCDNLEPSRMGIDYFSSMRDGGQRSHVGPILFVASHGQWNHTSIGAFQLYSMEEDGTNIHQLTSDSAYSVTDGSFSPNGKSVALECYSLKDLALIPSIYKMTIGRDTRERLTSMQGYHPVWSPDGEMIAFMVSWISDPISLNGIGFITSDGTKEKDLSPQGNLENLGNWSPDGTEISESTYGSVYDSLGNLAIYSQIAFCNLNGVLLRTLGTDDNRMYYPIFANKGDKIACMLQRVRRHGYFGLALLNLLTGNETDLTSTEALGINIWRPVSFSPDDKELLFNGGVTDLRRIFIINLETGNVREITPSPMKFIQSYAINWRRN